MDIVPDICEVGKLERMEDPAKRDSNVWEAR